MDKTKKNILLVGGGGYLGSHLGQLLTPNYNVYSTSRHQKENNIVLDLLNQETYKNIDFNIKYDYIILLAATLKGLDTKIVKHEYIVLEIIGYHGFLKFIATKKINSKIIYISSMTVYDINSVIPVKEESELNGLSAYGISKIMGESSMKVNLNILDSNVVILRIPGIYGGNRKSGFIYNTIVKCATNERVEVNTKKLGYWETIHIDDLCGWIIDFLSAYDWKSKLEKFNLGYGTMTDIIECANFIKETMNSKSKIKLKGVLGYVDFYLDNSKIKKIVDVQDRYKQSLTKYISLIKECTL